MGLANAADPGSLKRCPQQRSMPAPRGGTARWRLQDAQFQARLSEDYSPSRAVRAPFGSRDTRLSAPPCHSPARSSGGTDRPAPFGAAARAGARRNPQLRCRIHGGSGRPCPTGSVPAHTRQWGRRRHRLPPAPGETGRGSHPTAGRDGGGRKANASLALQPPPAAASAPRSSRGQRSPLLPQPPPSPSHLGSACRRSGSSAPCSRPGRTGQCRPGLGWAAAAVRPAPRAGGARAARRAPLGVAMAAGAARGARLDRARPRCPGPGCRRGRAARPRAPNVLPAAPCCPGNALGDGPSLPKPFPCNLTGSWRIMNAREKFMANCWYFRERVTKREPRAFPVRYTEEINLNVFENEQRLKNEPQNNVLKSGLWSHHWLMCACRCAGFELSEEAIGYFSLFVRLLISLTWNLKRPFVLFMWIFFPLTSRVLQSPP